MLDYQQYCVIVQTIENKLKSIGAINGDSGITVDREETFHSNVDSGCLCIEIPCLNSHYAKAIQEAFSGNALNARIWNKSPRTCALYIDPHKEEYLQSVEIALTTFQSNLPVTIDKRFSERKEAITNKSRCPEEIFQKVTEFINDKATQLADLKSQNTDIAFQEIAKIFSEIDSLSDCMSSRFSDQDKQENVIQWFDAKEKGISAPELPPRCIIM